MHSRAQRLAGVALAALLATVLWQPAGCVIPPPENVVMTENLPPTIDWTLCEPSAPPDGPVVRSEQRAFSITNAVSDPEGDGLFFQWYWVNAEGYEYNEDGDETMTLRPCDFNTLENTSFMMVTVVVSDRRLKYDKDSEGALLVEVTPGDGEDFDEVQSRVAVRTWFVDFIDDSTCTGPQ